MKNKDVYNPRGQVIESLECALDHVQSVEYKVSLRWVFYRLLQDGFFKSKGGYKSWESMCSRARHAIESDHSIVLEWRPDTLADETRAPIYRGFGHSSPEDYINSQPEQPCIIDKHRTQPAYVEAWFEARAMVGQFRTYTSNLTLRPMGGHPSIPYKFGIAKDLETIYGSYENPIVILYFGDLDDAGEVIGDIVEHDVRKWCDVDFKFIRCGLTIDQATRVNLPENPEKPGEYQWEALSDLDAQEIIESSIEPYRDIDEIKRIEEIEEETTDRVRIAFEELEL